MIEVLSNLEDFEGEEPWCDLIFEVVQTKKRLLSGETTLVLIATHDGKAVGVAVSTRKKDWDFHPPKDEDSIPLWWGKIALHSIGNESDALLALWRSYFQLPGVSTFVKRVDCLAVAIEGDPTNLHAAPLRTKLFFDDGSADDTQYAELFFNLDLVGGIASLNEKDPEYRAPLVRWLGGGIGNG
ncbi:MAG TPA: hypothetical protein VMN38_00470 [Sphingomicrobium sp.]|nr:hypothetical protein [Sphingomicrobium sp.]